MTPNAASASSSNCAAGSCPYDNAAKKLTASAIIETLTLLDLFSVNAFMLSSVCLSCGSLLLA